MFNLLKVCIDNVFYVSVSSVGLFFSNLFRFNEIGCFKLNSIKKAKKWSVLNCCFSLIKIMPTTLYFSYYHTNSIAMLYLVHKYKKTFESTNMNLSHSKIMIFF